MLKQALVLSTALAIAAAVPAGANAAVATTPAVVAAKASQPAFVSMKKSADAGVTNTVEKKKKGKKKPTT
jgi:hypothetical protein